MNDDNNRLELPVILSMQDGRELCGNLIVNLGGAIDRTLNNEARFILFSDEQGNERMISKSGILEVRDARRIKNSAHAPKSDSSTPRMQVDAPGLASDVVPGPVLASTSAHQALGVSEQATDDEIRIAFVALAQAYNPDRLASLNLPAEAAQFCDEKYQEISAAYAKLTEGKTPALT